MLLQNKNEIFNSMYVIKNAFHYIKYSCYKMNYCISHFHISIFFILQITLRIKVFLTLFEVYLHINE